VATIGATAAVAIAAAFALILELLDHLIEPGDDVLLYLLRVRPAAREFQATLDVVHLASDFTQVLLLPGAHVEGHEHGHETVALGDIDAITEEANDALGGVFLHHEGGLGHGTVEAVSCGTNHPVAPRLPEGAQRASRTCLD